MHCICGLWTCDVVDWEIGEINYLLFMVAGVREMNTYFMNTYIFFLHEYNIMCSKLIKYRLMPCSRQFP